MSKKTAISPSPLDELIQKRNQLQGALLEQTQSLRDAQQSVDTTGSELESIDSQIRSLEAQQAEQARLSALDDAGKEARAIADRINAAVQTILTEFPKLQGLLTKLPGGSVSSWYDGSQLSKMPICLHNSSKIEIRKLQDLSGGDRAALRATYPQASRFN